MDIATETPDPYAAVNAAWPDKLPAVTVEHAGKMAQRLWKTFASHEGAKPEGLRRYKRKPRRCWGSTDRTRNSLSAGWRRMVHDVSHIMLTSANPLRKDHGRIHADLELRMIRHVLTKGWLDPKPEADKPDPRAVRYARVLAGIERWKPKLRRAQNALEKLVRQRRYYEQQFDADKRVADIKAGHIKEGPRGLAELLPRVG